MTEQQVQRKIIKWLESENYYVVKVMAASKSGVPDILACCPDGKFLAIEVKTPQKRNNTSKLQEYNLDKIRQCNGLAFVACSVEEVRALLTSTNL
jgi:Holliday junction resolvase